MGRRKIEADYLLEKAEYMSTLWHIRRYPSLVLQREEILEGSAAPPDGMPRGSGVGDPTLNKAAKIEAVDHLLDPIVKGLEKIPEEYRKGIFDNIVYRVPYPDYAALNTWKRWRQRYIYFVANLLK